MTKDERTIGILADLLAAGVNTNLAFWTLAPLATEVESQTIRWIAALIGATIGGPLPATGPAVTVAAGSVTIQNTTVVSHAVGVENAGGAVVQDYNLFHGNGVDTQGSVSGGAHNAAGDPRFVDALLDDYHLGPGSAAVDAGINVGVVHDIDGDLRPAGGGFDIGFDERSQGARRVYLPLVDRKAPHHILIELSRH